MRGWMGGCACGGSGAGGGVGRPPQLVASHSQQSLRKCWEGHPNSSHSYGRQAREHAPTGPQPCRRARRGAASGRAASRAPAGAARRPPRARRPAPAPRSCPVIGGRSGLAVHGMPVQPCTCVPLALAHARRCTAAQMQRLQPPLPPPLRRWVSHPQVVVLVELVGLGTGVGQEALRGAHPSQQMSGQQAACCAVP